MGMDMGMGEKENCIIFFNLFIIHVKKY